MARGEWMLSAMRTDPRADWSIADVKTVCTAYDIRCAAPPIGLHHVLSHPAVPGRLTIPSRWPMKPLYVRLLVAMVDGLAR